MGWRARGPGLGSESCRRCGSAAFRAIDPRRICLPGQRSFGACAVAGGWGNSCGRSPRGPLAAECGVGNHDGRAGSRGGRCSDHDRARGKGRDRVRLLPPRTIKTGDNIVGQGAQARRGDTLLPAGTRVGPAQVALAAACGYAELDVFARPRIAILATGDELVPVEATPGPGQIRNSNAPMLAVLVSAAGGEPWVLPAAADTAESLDGALARRWTRTCCSFRAGFRPVSLTWSSRRWSEEAHASISPGCVYSPESPGVRGCDALGWRKCGGTPQAERAAVLRPSRQPYFFGRYVSAIRCAGAAGLRG